MSKKIKCLITLLIICIMCITTVYAASFSDIEGHWEKDVMEKMTEKGIIITASYSVDELDSALVVKDVADREFKFYGDSTIVDLDRLENELTETKILFVMVSETEEGYEFEEVELLELSDVRIKKEDRIDTIPAGLTVAKFKTAEIILIIRGL